MIRSVDRPSSHARLLPVTCLAACALLYSPRARAQAAPPAGHEDAAFDFMNLLSHEGLHDIDRERWNAYGQFTYIGSYKPSFPAAYTNPSARSLLQDEEFSFTGTFTLFFGVALWPGGQVYFVPEVIAERALSGLHGIGGAIQNFELQKQGSETPQLYRSRTYLKQTFGFGGKPAVQESQPMQLATTVDSRRLTLTVGNFTIVDVFDRNSVSWDPRQTFLNMAFMTYSSWDFPSDARGYSWGATAELSWDDWAVRIGRITPPQDPNTLPIDFRLWKYYGDQLELEHDHVWLGQPGAVRVLGYHNRVRTGGFDDAVAAYQADPTKNAAAAMTYFPQSISCGWDNPNAPDLCWVRKPNDKLGVGISVEQHVLDDVGVFVRAMYSDGRTEVDAYNPADRSIAFGAVAKGSTWRRPFDVTGVGFAMSWISAAHARYLAMGGVDGFVGDGALRQAAEGVVEGFYSLNLFKAMWLTADYQLLWNPGFNADRGPVNILGGRVHAEF